MRIVIDAFGGDNAPLSVLQGAEMAVKEYGVEVTLTGDESIIKKCAAENGISLQGMEIFHTESVFDMHDEPSEILKAKRATSLGAAFDLVAAGKGDAVLSAGSTGAIVVGGTFILKRIKGIKRTALGSHIPTETGHFFLMDIGANAECRPEMLLQFGIMSSVYAQKVLKIENPTVGLLNIGTEDTKGDTLRLEAYKLLSQAPINFVGNVEARDLPQSPCDVVVADGFTGNIALKLYEGVAMGMMSMIKKVYKKNFITKLSALIVKSGLLALKSKADYTEVGGAPLLGTQKPVIKAHGSSNGVAIKNAIRQAMDFCNNNVIEEITNGVAAMNTQKEEE